MMNSASAMWAAASPFVLKGVAAMAIAWAGYMGIGTATGQRSDAKKFVAAADSVRVVEVARAACPVPVRDTVYLPAAPVPVLTVPRVPRASSAPRGTEAPTVARDTTPKQEQSQGQGVVVNVYTGRTDSTGGPDIRFDTIHPPPVILVDTVARRGMVRKVWVGAGVVGGAVLCWAFCDRGNPRSAPPTDGPKGDDHGKPWDKGREHGGRKP